MEGTVRLLRELRGDGRMRLFALTNFSRQNWDKVVRRYGFLAWFQDVLVSADVGVCKPEPDIFRLAQRRFDVDPARTLFVDDQEANVEGARAAGFLAHRFTTAASLRRDLESRGALAPRIGATGRGAAWQRA